VSKQSVMSLKRKHINDDKEEEDKTVELDKSIGFYPSNLTLVYEGKKFMVHQDIVCFKSQVLATLCTCSESKTLLNIPAVKYAGPRHFKHFVDQMYDPKAPTPEEFWIGTLYLFHWADCKDLLDAHLEYPFIARVPTYVQSVELSQMLQLPFLLEQKKAHMMRVLKGSATAEARRGVLADLVTCNKEDLVKIIDDLTK
jgi:hypothetical protein